MVKKTGVLIFCAIFCSCLSASASAPKKRGRMDLRPSPEQFQLKQKVLNNILEQTRESRHSLMNSSLARGQQRAAKKKGRAFLQSLILPGWGQHYAESKTMMKVFIATEVLLWSSYLGFQTWGNWLEDDYRTFAVQHAGVNLEGKPDRYFVDISNFNGIFEHNQAQLRNRDISAVYTDTETFFWKWDSAENRGKFEDMRLRSDRARNRADLALAFVFTNHIISAIQSTLAVFKFNDRLKKQGLGLRFEYQGYSENRYLKIGLVKRF